ncbi:MAG TPA: thrombospondin type 3 repeat-containing protein [Phycisphaerae bacterium]|nr:thrombospondin type 3 repeat-containing protein [Phycisphaerae bacterium]
MSRTRVLSALALVTVLLLGAAPWAAAQQEPECHPVFTLEVPDQCVAPDQAFQPVELQALLDQQNPGHAPVSAWTISSASSLAPPDVTIDGGIATITYPATFVVGCRSVEFLAWKDVCGSDLVQARGIATFSVAPAPVILAIPPQQSAPQAADCDTIVLDLDANLEGGVDPADIQWTASGQQTLQVTIDPNTHVATVINTSDSCEAVSETITFRACLPEGDNHDPDCLDCPEYCDRCAEATVTFTLICDADGDGVADHCDICPGYNDALDDDNDGVPDGCDCCPGGEDSLDADGDGVPDACDVCEGYNDNADADEDGIPDGCDQDPGPQPVPQPCPECPGSIETVAVGWFCPAAATVMLALLGAGVFLTGRSGRRS